MNDVAPKRSRRAKAPTTPDPIEIAMEAEAAGAPADGVAHEVLTKHARLLDAQIGLAAQERFRNRIRSVRDTVFALAGVLAVAGVGWVLVDASRASGIVIRPFDTTPALTEQGLGGEAVANDLLGRVAALQAGVDSSRAERRASGASDELSVVIPQTGISVGELLRMLRARLGHETAVAGALRPGPDGVLTLSLRLNGRRVAVTPPPGPVTAETLLAAAAETVMRETDIYRYSQWLRLNGRREEALALTLRLTQTGPPRERAWAWAALSAFLGADGRPQEAIAAGRTAHALDPTQPTAANNIRSAQALLGHAEDVRATLKEGAQALGRTKGDERFGEAIAAVEHDWNRMAALARRTLSGSPSATDIRNALGNLSYAQAGRHEATAARATLAQIMNPPFRPMRAFDVAIAPAVAVEDWAAVGAILALPWDVAPSNRGDFPFRDRTLRWPWQAYVAARGGQFAEAEALIAATPGDCYLCVQMRGEIAALKGDAAGADRWFAEAVRQGPSLADADLAWGRAKLARGDAAGALVLFEAAAKKAPGCADPPKYAGDALARLGKPKPALARYAAAAKLAPRWGGLNLAWGEALAKVGKGEDARAKWRAAAGMDLTADERAELTRVMR